MSAIIKAFQSGRQYTSHGQRIAYKMIVEDTSHELVAVSKVAFYDVDRMIGGVLNVIHTTGRPIRDQDVLESYDAGGYEWLSDKELEVELMRAAAAL